MPNIPTYTNPIDRIEPSNRGIEAEVQAGRRIGTFYHQEGDVLGGAISGAADLYGQHQAQQEVLHLQDAGSQIILNHTAAGEQAFQQAGPGDHSVAPAMLEDVRQSFDDLSEHATTPAGQAYVSKLRDSAMQFFQTKWLSAQSEQDGAYAQDTLTQLGNTQSALASHDPSSLDSLLSINSMHMDALAGTFDKTSPAASAELRSKGLTSLNAQTFLAAVHGTALTSEDAATTMLNNPKYRSLVSEAQRREAQNDIHTTATQARNDMENAARFQEFQKHVANDNEVDRIMRSGQPYSYEQAKQNPLLNEEGRNAILHMNTDDAKGDPIVQHRNFETALAAARQAHLAGTPPDVAAVYKHIGSGPDSLTREQAGLVVDAWRGQDAPTIPTGQGGVRTANEAVWKTAGASTGAGLWGSTVSRPDKVVAAQAYNYYDSVDQQLIAKGIPPGERYADPVNGASPNSVYYGKPISSWGGSTNAPHPAAGRSVPGDGRAAWKALGH